MPEWPEEHEVVPAFEPSPKKAAPFGPFACGGSVLGTSLDTLAADTALELSRKGAVSAKRASTASVGS
jgi:hypothetical protein